MNKKGFTLVEVLAVIAIIAILAVIAIPNIMDSFNDAKRRSFENEVREILKVAQGQWALDLSSTRGEIVYAKGNNCDNFLHLDLTGRSELDYGITFDRSGNVDTFYATDGEFVYFFQFEGDNLTVDSIGKGTISDFDEPFIEDNTNTFFTLKDFNYNSANFMCNSSYYDIYFN